MNKLVLGLSLSIFIAGCASRDPADSGANLAGVQTVSGSDSRDATFARQACQTGVTELEVGKLASRNTRNPEVRKLARKLAADHERAEKELGRLFARKNIAPEEKLAHDLQSSLDELGGLQAQEFDVAFKEHVIQYHKKAIELFEKQATQGTDPDLKAFAAKHLPRLRQHLSEAQSLDVATNYGAPEPAGIPVPLANPASRHIAPPK